MFNFSIEAFAKGCSNMMNRGQSNEQANRELLETYCAYLQQSNNK